MKSEFLAMARISSSLLEKHKGLLTSPQVDTGDRENRTILQVQLPKMCGLFFFLFFISRACHTL